MRDLLLYRWLMMPLMFFGKLRGIGKVILLSLLIIPSLSYATTTLAYDTFSNSSPDGYSRDDGNTDRLKMLPGNSSYKIYDFGKEYANADITVSFTIYWWKDWDNSWWDEDKTIAKLNGNEVVNKARSGTGSESYQFNTTLDSDGKIRIDFTNTSDDKYENMTVDDVKITTDYVPATNHAPTDITLSNNHITENNAVGAVIGDLSTTDADSGDTFTYTIVGGDTADFTIDGNQLKAAKSFDYETKSNYTVRIKTDDGYGGTYEKDFTIVIDDQNEADISLGQYASASPNPVNEGEEVTYYLRGIKDSKHDSLANIELQISFNLDVDLVSIDQVAGGDEFENCNIKSGTVSAGTTITCTKRSTLATTAPNKDVEIKVKPQASGTLTMTATLVPKTTPDPDMNNNRVTSSVDVIKTCNGCDCSGDDPTSNNSAPGATIAQLDGATGDVNKCIYGTSPNRDPDYYHFTVGSSGTLKITGTSPNDHDYHLRVGDENDDEKYYVDKTTKNHDVPLITLNAGDEVRIYVKETGSNTDEYKLNFDFKSDNTNHAPVAYSQKVTTKVNKDINITLRAEDQDGDSINYTIVTQPSHGTLSGTAPTLTYTPDADYIGTDLFTFRADDGNLSSEDANISIRVADSTYTEGPDICYSFREEKGIKLPFMEMFYKETTGVRANRDIDNVRIYKGIVRGFDIFSMMSGIGIGDVSKTTQAGDDQAEQRNFAQADFVNNDYTMLQILPGGTAYRLGDGAGSGENEGGSMREGDETSYYNSAFFKLGFFTQYAHVVTYEKDGQEYTEVLQPCDSDEYGPLEKRPPVEGCGLFMGALNSATKVTFDVSAGVWQLIRNEQQVNTPVIDNSNGAALCSDNQPCTADGIGSTPIELPAFIYSQETQANIITQGAVIGGKQHIGPITITHDDKTECDSNNNRTFAFEAPYSASYEGKVMLIKSINDTDSTCEKHTYVFKEGDYWIEDWSISGTKNVTIKTSGKVRFFIKNPFNVDIDGALNIGQDAGDTSPATDPKFYMFVYDDINIDVTGASAVYLGYIYSKGKITLGSTTTFAVKYGGITADDELTVRTGAPGDFVSYKEESDPETKPYFEECKALTVQWQFTEYHISEDTQSPMPPKKLVIPKPTIVLSRKVPYDVNVSYRTYDGTALYGSDYVKVDKTVTIPAGENNVSVDISIYNDPPIELTEDFFIELYNPQSDGNVTLNDKNTTRVVIDEQMDSPICFDDDFSNGLDSKWRVIKGVGYTPKVVNVNGDYRLRITPGSYRVATAVTKDYMFETKKNLIIVEFDYYAYNGCGGGHGGIGADGADGIVNVLFDSKVGDTPSPGSYGGSIGYAQRDNGDAGFEGGWLGLGIDEYGNFGNCNEGRIGGLPNTSCDQGTGFNPQSHRNTAVIRGDGNGTQGYEFLSGVEFTQLTPPMPKVAERYVGESTGGYYSGRYKMVVDAKHEGHLYIRLARDVGNGYQTVINEFDAMDPKYNQGSTPEFVRYAITGGTGGGCNNHEISWIQLRGNCQVYAISGSYVTGPFGAVDTYRWDTSSTPHKLLNNDPKQRVINTKIVNKPFKLRLVSFAENGTESEKKPDINVKYGVFAGDTAQGYVLETLRDANFTDKADFETDDFRVGTAYSRAHIRIFYCGDYNGSDTQLYSLDQCWDSSKSDQENMLNAVPETSEIGKHLFFHTSDLFAVKPADFNASIEGDTNKYTGEPVTFYFGATRDGGGRAPGYAESADSTFKVLVGEKKDGCSVGTFHDVDLINGWSFKDGVGDSNVTDSIEAVITHYDEVGDINITITDEVLPCKERFASIDCNDLNISGSWDSEEDTKIGSATLDLNISAKYFEVTGTFEAAHMTVSDINFTYLSNDLKEASKVALNIRAIDDLTNKKTIENFNKECYAKDVKIGVNYILDGINTDITKKILYRAEDDSSTSPTVVEDNVTFANNMPLIIDMPKDIFNTDHNGSANVNIKLNFNRWISEAVEPFDMNISTIDVNSSDDMMEGNISIDKHVTYLYARIKPSKELYDNIRDNSVKTPVSIVVNYTGTGAVKLSSAFVTTNEYDWVMNTLHMPEDGKISLTPQNSSDGSIAPSAPDMSGGYNGDVTVSAVSDERPLVVPINIDDANTDSWLIYNPNGTEETPQPLYRVRFIGEDGWFGVGETGRVIDTKSNIKRNNRVEW